MRKGDRCFVCGECCTFNCPNILRQLAGDKGVDMGLELVRCKDCLYMTGKCEDCLLYQTDLCEKRRCK